MLKQFITQFTTKEIITDFVTTKYGYFSVNKTLQETLSKISIKPVFAGTPLGREKNKTFVPSLFLLQKIAAVSDKKICVDAKGTWLFICGKDIFSKSITKHPSVFNKNDFVLIENEHGECFGYGKITGDLHNKGVVVENFFDIGDFLRRERR